MQYLFLIIIFLFGTALGSFVTVIANRFNTGLPFFRGRSFCFSCNTKLQKKDLVPLFSFLFLKGRCRYCKSKIPRETLIIEILMGILSVLSALKSGFSVFDFSLLSIINYLLLTFIFATILLIAVYDIKHFIIPDSFLFTLFLFSLFYISLSNFIIQTNIINNIYSLIPFFISSIILTLPFLLIFVISKGRWLGFGDIKYILVLGFLLGFSQGLSAVILAFWIGAAFSLIILSLKYFRLHINLPLLRNNFTIKSEIPFGPFLSIGIIISLYLNADLFQIHSLFNIF